MGLDKGREGGGKREEEMNGRKSLLLLPLMEGADSTTLLRNWAREPFSSY